VLFSDDPIIELEVEIILYGVAGIFLIIAPTLLVLFTSKGFSIFNILVLFLFACRAIYGEIVGRINIILNPDIFILTEENTEEVLKDEDTKQ